MTARATSSHWQYTRSWIGSGLYILAIAFLGIVAASGMAGVQQAIFLVLVVAAAGAALIRKRHPCVLLLLAWLTTAFATQVLLIPALFNMGVRGRDRRTLLALAFTVVLLAAVGPRGEQLVSVDGVDLEVWSTLGSWALNTIVVIVPYLIGQGVATRRDLLESYRLRAEYAEAERSARAAESVLLERARIAREAHDVLGRKLSLLVMQTGGLRINKNASEKVVDKQLKLIQESARDALEELRSIIGSIEDPNAPGTDRSDRSLVPKDLFGIRKLVDESVSSGAIVNLSESDLLHSDKLPEDISGAAYRVVQECLTNAHMHAPGAPVSIVLSGGPGEKFVVEVRNTVVMPEANGNKLPRSGRGIPRLKERARILDGELTAGEIDSVFIVRAQFPWRNHGDEEAVPQP